MLPQRFHLSGHTAGFLPDSEVGTTLQDSILNHSGIERVKTNNFRLPKNEKKEGLKN